MDKNSIKTGDFIVILKDKEKWEGKVVQVAENLVTLKLNSGYNVGIKIDEGTKIKKLWEEKVKKHRPVKFELKFSKSKPLVSVLAAGGTIASSIDYRTGAISASYTASQLIASIPELVNFANIKSKKILEEMSENLTPKHWKKIGREVFRELKESEGIVLTHGTDTLSYTSSMLSFMLRNLNKPVVLTFAQKSSDRGSSDASMNLICSTITATKNIAEVVVVGHGTISDDYCLINRGNKVRKMHSSQRNSFRPINCFPIGKVWPDGRVEFLDKYKKKEEVKEDCYLDDKIEEKVAIIKFYPGLDSEIVDFYVDKGYKRPVYFYKDRGEIALEEEDGLIIFSVSGEDFPKKAAEIGKEERANIVSFTSEGSPLEEISDAVIHVPTREEDKPKGAVYHMQPDPAKCMPEYVELLYGECYVCKVAQIENVTEREFNNTHSKIT